MRTVAETTVHAKTHLAYLSQDEILGLIAQTDQGLYPLIRNCALAVLNTGVNSDDGLALFQAHQDFDIRFERHPRGLQLTLLNAPSQAFVDGRLVARIHDHLFSVIRDLVYVRTLRRTPDRTDAHAATNLVFEILRHGDVLASNRELSTIVCWGGHSIGHEEYEYSKAVGRELGLRYFQVCTGCGPGAMKGPMRGAIDGHRLQAYGEGRFLGITEPGIIGAEPPNGFVSDLVIMPDIEKRLEAFVRMAHAIVIFPGGAGTFEELLYLLAILTEPANADQPMPVILTGPVGSEPTIQAYLDFIDRTLGPPARQRLTVLINDPEGVARTCLTARAQIREARIKHQDAYHFNWTLKIPDALSERFHPTHASMAALPLHRDQSAAGLAATLRCAFSGIVSGNVKPETRQAIAKHGPFSLHGEPDLMQAMDTLLTQLVAERRIKLHGDYQPCYRLHSTP